MMEDHLHCKDLYNPTEGDNAKPSDMSDVDWNELKKKNIGCHLPMGGH